MNERIRELEAQAENYAESKLEEGYAYDEIHFFYRQKFAELIVRECIACVRGAVLADDVALRNNLGFNDGITEGVVHIQKHFGVEK